jgi:hypothetical protein
VGRLLADERVPFGRLVAPGQRAHRLSEQQRQLREGIAKQARDPQGHIEARPFEQGDGQDFHARHPVGGTVPHRFGAQQVERHGKLLARRAHRGRTPEVDDERTRPVAMVLKMAAHEFFGEGHALRMGGAAGHRARVDRVEIAARGQDIAAPAIGRAGGPGATRRPASAARRPVRSARPCSPRPKT